MTLDREALANLAKAAERAGLPWHLVGKPWMADDQCDTYAISGSTDPHAGTPTIQWMEPDEHTQDGHEDERNRFYLWFAVEAANAIPGLLAELSKRETTCSECGSYAVWGLGPLVDEINALRAERDRLRAVVERVAQCHGCNAAHDLRVVLAGGS